MTAKGRGFLAATLFLSALPLAALSQLLLGKDGEIVVHFAMAAGSGLLCSAMPHFRTPAWATWLGYLSTGSLAAIFASQGIAQAWESEPLARVAFEGLGQHVEGWLLNGFLVWCLVAVLTGGAGKSKAFGLVAVAMAAGVRIYAAALSSSGGSLETTAPALKLLYLVPFVWLLLATAGWRQRRG